MTITVIMSKSKSMPMVMFSLCNGLSASVQRSLHELFQVHLAVGGRVLPLALLLGSRRPKTDPRFLAANTVRCYKPGDNFFPSGFWFWQLTQRRVTGRDPDCALEFVRRWGLGGRGLVGHLLYLDTGGNKLERGARCDSHKIQAVAHSVFSLGLAWDMLSLLDEGSSLVHPAILGCLECKSLAPLVKVLLNKMGAGLFFFVGLACSLAEPRLGIYRVWDWMVWV